jgi:hypothetical protein
MMKRHMGESNDAFVYKGFTRRLAKKSPERISPGEECIKYAQFSTCLSLWFGGVMGISPSEFLSRYGSQSGRNGGASVASNTGIPLKIWGQHGD